MNLLMTVFIYLFGFYLQWPVKVIALVFIYFVLEHIRDNCMKSALKIALSSPCLKYSHIFIAVLLFYKIYAL